MFDPRNRFPNASQTPAVSGHASDQAATTYPISTAGQVAEYILTHQGPDQTGRAFHKKIQIETLEEGLAIARVQGLPPEIKPYFFKAIDGLYSRTQYAEEVVQLKVCQLLAQTYANNLGRLVQSVTQAELLTPLVVAVGNRTYEVNVYSAMDTFGRSPSRAVMHTVQHLALTDERFAPWAEKLRPWHFNVAQRETFTKSIDGQRVYDMEMCGTLVSKHVAYLLATKFNGSVGALISGITGDDFTQPFVDEIGSTNFRVSSVKAFQGFNNSPSACVMHSFARWAQEDSRFEIYAQRVKPWHFFSSIPQRTFADCAPDLSYHHKMEVCGPLMVRKVQDVFARTYNNDLARLVRGISLVDLETPLVEEINGEQLAIPMGSVVDAFGGSPPKAVIFSVSEWAKVRPEFAEWAEKLRHYHFTRACYGSYSSQGTESDRQYDLEACGAIAVRKVRDVLENVFAGNVGRMIQEIEQSHLIEPLIDVIAGEPFEVVTATALGAFNSRSTSEVVMYAIAEWAKAEERFEVWAAKLRDWHFQRAQACRYSRNEVGQEVKYDIDACGALVCRKIDQLLQSAPSMKSLLAGVRQTDLCAALVEEIGGVEFHISMGTPMAAFNSSPFQAFEYYHRTKGLPIAFSPLCFVGSAETRMRRLEGQLSRYDWEVIQTEPGHYDTAQLGFRQFNSPEKVVVRQLMFEHAAHFLGDTPVHYLGLETEQFTSLRIVAEQMSLESGIVVEHDSRVVQAMHSAKSTAPTGTRALLSNVEILEGDINKVISGLRTTPRNLVFLDYTGQLSDGKIGALCRLVERGLLAEKTFLIVTVNVSPLALQRASSKGFSGQADEILANQLKETLPASYSISDSIDIAYRGGTDIRSGSNMHCIGFGITR
jgi:hypothetical protein